MFDVKAAENNEVQLVGRFDAAQVEKARSVFDKLTSSAVINFQELEYISSAGLGVLLMTQRRLRETGNGLKLTNMNKHIRDVFEYAGFDKIFEIV